MTVQELIDRLKQENPEKKVMLHDGYSFLHIGVIGSPTEWIEKEYIAEEERDYLVIGIVD